MSLSAAESVELSSGSLTAVESMTLLQALAAVMAGARSYVAIAEWAAVADQPVAVCGRPASEATIRRILTSLNVTALETALSLLPRSCARSGHPAADGVFPLPRPAIHY